MLAAADLARDARDWRQAVERYKAYLQYRPGHGAIWVQHGHALKELGQLDDAVAAYERAAEIDPKDPDPLLHLGHLFLRLVRVGQAGAVFERRQELCHDDEIAGIVAALRNPTPEPASDQPAFEGHVDRITRNRAEGWVWCPADPEREIFVEALLGDRIIGRARADMMRADLLAYDKGTGRYGYSIVFNAFVSGEDVPVVRVAPDQLYELQSSAKLPPLSDADRRKRAAANVERLLSDHEHFTRAGPHFEEPRSDIIGEIPAEKRRHKPLVLAYYLPQFHPIAENDAFWGRGFTEWRQLARALPRFPGHYQPRIPRDLGFYELGDAEILRRQARLALDAGIGAFCYYYYWFNGRKVLDLPLEAHLASDVDMPFAIMWANENWTRTWDGSDDAVLLRQDYREEDEEALLADLARSFADPRYVRLSGRPLFFIYNPSHIPDAPVTIQRWRDLFKSRHGCEPLIFMAQAFAVNDPRPFGLDGAIEFPPHKLTHNMPGREMPDAFGGDFAGRVIPYDDVVAASTLEPAPPYPLIKVAAPSWDNEARRPGRGLTFEGSSPDKYERWVQALVERAIEAPVWDTPVIAINAWNEWAEAAYLEPDVHFGAAYLNATARGIVGGVASYGKIEARSNSQRVTAVLPCYNHARFLPERIGSILRQSVPPDEIVFLDDGSSDGSVDIAEDLLAKGDIPYTIVRNPENSGQVFRQWLKGLELASHELVWIAETDDTADRRFLEKILPAFDREHVLAAFGRIRCIDLDGNLMNDLEDYFSGLENISWTHSRVIPAGTAFAHDFAVKNIIPNASGLVFRRPILNAEEVARLQSYSFAGDWYFYTLMLRGGDLAYCRDALSYFRINPHGASRSSLFGERHLQEHRMVLQDIAREYGLSGGALRAHGDSLLPLLPEETADSLPAKLGRDIDTDAPSPHLRICIFAHSFAVGGGEVLPLELANELRSRGHHVSYMVLEPLADCGGPSIRARLRSDIPVFHWADVEADFGAFIREHRIDVLNTHNVGVDIKIAATGQPPCTAWIVTHHGGYETVPDMITTAFVAYMCKHVDRWFYLSEKNKAPLLGKGMRDEGFVRCFNALSGAPVDWLDRSQFRAALGIPAEAFCLVICSRALPEKGWDVAADVAIAVQEQTGRDVHICLMGAGPMSDRLRERHAGNHRVHVLGHVENPLRALRCFDLAIFPSVYSGESFPLFLLECFAAGLPVVSTTIGEIPRMMTMTDHIPGALVDWDVPRGEMVKEMARHVGEFVTDADSRERAARAAQEASAHLTMDKLADFYLEHANQLARSS